MINKVLCIIFLYFSIILLNPINLISMMEEESPSMEEESPSYVTREDAIIIAEEIKNGESSLSLIFDAVSKNKDITHIVLSDDCLECIWHGTPQRCALKNILTEEQFLNFFRLNSAQKTEILNNLANIMNFLTLRIKFFQDRKNFELEREIIVLILTLLPIQGHNGSTILHSKIARENEFFITILLEFIKTTNHINSIEIITNLLKKQNKLKQTPLHWAAHHGNINFVITVFNFILGIIPEKAIIIIMELLTTENDVKSSQLHWAVSCNQIDFIIDVFQFISKATSAANSEKSIKYIMQLLKKQNTLDETPLHWAAEFGLIDCMLAIFNFIIKIEPTYGKKHIISLLKIEAFRETPLKKAEKKGYMELIEDINQYVSELDPGNAKQNINEIMGIE